MSMLNFGSLNIDFVYGVDHFVRKGETISSRELRVFPGGKGLNQSIALSRAGADVRHAGLIGEDGLFLRDLLAESGVDVSQVRVSETMRSGNAIIQNDSEGDNCIILYGGTNRAIDRAFVDEALAGYGEGDWLLLQNEISELPYIVERASAKGMRIVLNPSPADERLFELNLDAVDCFVLNEGEAAWLGGAGGGDGTGGADAGALRAMRRRFPRADIVLTLGERGSLLLRAGSDADEPDAIIRQKAYRVPTVDTTAAGDTFTGYLLAGLMQGKPAPEALDMAAKASAIAVSRPGAAPSIPTLAEVEAFAVPVSAGVAAVPAA